MTEPRASIQPVDVALAVSGSALEVAVGATRRASRAVRPVVALVLRPPVLPAQLQPGRWMETIGNEGESRRTALAAEISGRLDVLVPAVLAEVLRHAHLTDLILRYVDLGPLIEAILDQLDLVELAGEVIDGVDLPEIIRESTGSMASDTVRGVRMQGIVADEAVGRAVDRLLLRRGRRATQAPGPPEDPGRDEPSRRGGP